MKKQSLRGSAGALPVALALMLALSGCVSNQPKPEEAAPAPVAAEPPPVVAAPEKPVCPPVDKKAKTKKSSKTKQPVPGQDCVPAATASPPPAAAAPARQATGGYDLSKNKPVTDSTKVESGQGTTVKGINDWEGEITGLPAANSRFTKLKIGMPQQQVIDLVGQPTDQGAYITGKAFIPFYFGSDKSRWEMVYKGQGRLIFSNQSGFGTGYYLTWIIHNANEGGYR